MGGVRFFGGSAFDGAQRLSAFPEGLAAELAHLLDAFQHRREVIAGEQPGLAQVRALPSSRFMPIQSQPVASLCRSSSLHSWSSQALPVTLKFWPLTCKLPLAANWGWL